VAHPSGSLVGEETDLTYEGIETHPPYREGPLWLVPCEETDLTYEGIETWPVDKTLPHQEHVKKPT